MYDSRNVEVVRYHQQDLLRVADEARLAREVQTTSQSKRRFHVLVDEFRSRFNRLSQAI